MSFQLPSLQWLPTEILENIVVLLDLRDICSLRLVSRSTASKTKNGIFKTFSTAKRMTWDSSAGLHEFAYMTQPGRMGCELEHLTLVGIVSNQDSQAARGERLLEQAFNNLRLHSPSGSLQSLTLTVQVRILDGSLVPCDKVIEWQPIWEVAARTFEIALRALGASKLPIQKLNVLNTVTRCSLACNWIGSLMDRVDLSKPFCNLTQLSLSLSNHLRTKPRNEYRDYGAAAGKRHASDVVRFLELCPRLEIIELHWYWLKGGNMDTYIEERDLLAHVVKSERLFPEVRECRLKGMWTEGATLLALFKMMPELQRVSLEGIQLPQETRPFPHFDSMSDPFRPVFEYLTSHERALNYLFLDDLWERQVLVFDASEEPLGYSSTSQAVPNSLTRTGSECQRTIEYYNMADSMNWEVRTKLRLRSERNYGPASELSGWTSIDESLPVFLRA